MDFSAFLNEFRSVLPKTIIDFKAISPKDGTLFRDCNPVEVARMLEREGVFALSVVTEPEHFGGSLELLKSITRAVKLPVLRKDFIKNADDLHITVDCGAKSVLLICATIPRRDFADLYKTALLLGLNPVVEVHNKEELEFAQSLNAKIIGINNKDITALEKDSGTVNTTRELISSAAFSDDVFIISESGISTAYEAQQALDCGANAVLIGTAFWKSI